MRMDGALNWEDLKRVNLNKDTGGSLDDTLTWRQFLYAPNQKNTKSKDTEVDLESNNINSD